MTYRIRTVAEMTGIPRNTLIAWERRYGFIRPERHPNGYRSYSETDVEKLRRVQNAMHAGLKISEAVALLKRESELRDPGELGTSQSYSTEGFEQIVDELTDALVSYRRTDADSILARLTPVAFKERLHLVLFPVLRRIGDLWAEGAVTIAQEHYASAILRTYMAGVLLGIGAQGSLAEHAACTTFVGDMHELAALALAIQLSLEGRRVSYLGPNLPAEEAVAFCKSQSVKMLCVSAIRRPDEAALCKYVKVVSQLAESGTRVVLGGRLLADFQITEPSGVEIVPHWEDFDPRGDLN